MACIIAMSVKHRLNCCEQAAMIVLHWRQSLMRYVRGVVMGSSAGQKRAATITKTTTTTCKKRQGKKAQNRAAEPAGRCASRNITFGCVSLLRFDVLRFFTAAHSPRKTMLRRKPSVLFFIFIMQSVECVTRPRKIRVWLIRDVVNENLHAWSQWFESETRRWKRVIN